MKYFFIYTFMVGVFTFFNLMTFKSKDFPWVDNGIRVKHLFIAVGFAIAPLFNVIFFIVGLPNSVTEIIKTFELKDSFKDTKFYKFWNTEI